MLFNSYLFVLGFLPLTLAGLWVCGRRGGPQVAITWLILASVAFYGWWSLADLALIVVLTLVNYGLGWLQSRSWDRYGRGNRSLLIIGIGLDLAILGYFKYTDFSLATINALTGASLPMQHIILPLGISFYTFQKIAFLADSYQGKTRGFGFRDYCLFVTFFPQLIAGPIVHHHDVIGQFKALTGRLKAEDLAVGLTLFVFGLFKKVVIADHVAPTSDAVFAAAQSGQALSLGEAWIGSLAYAVQLYFDFSGYSDMAVGLARMCSIRLPMNFNSPYQAGDIIEFWRRWHMTLSRFLRDYLYIPLGGNRHGESRRYVNLFLTFLIGGLWHGAAWTFLAWGALHGLFTCLCHGWRVLRARLGWTNPGWLARGCGWLLTFLCVLVSWVFFRADSCTSALAVLASMAGSRGFSVAASPLISHPEMLLVAGSLLIAFLAPNTMRILHAAEPCLNHTEAKPCWLAWRLSWAWAAITALLAVLALQSMSKVSHFLYFQF